MNFNSFFFPLRSRAWFISLTLLVLVLPLSCLPLLQAGINRWTSVGGPAGGTILALAIDPADPKVIYAGTAGSGLIRSQDGGGTWHSITIDLFSDSSYVEAIAVDPRNSGVLYVGTSERLLKSADKGLTWTASLQNALVSAIAVDPSNSAVVYAGSTSVVSEFGGYPGGVFKSTDGGLSWTLIIQGPSFTKIRINESGTIIYGGTDGGIFKSSDAGQNWQSISSGLPVSDRLGNYPLAMDPTDTNILFAGACCGVFKSTDGGVSWVSSSSGLPADSSVLALEVAPNDPDVLFASFDLAGGQCREGGGLYRSVNGGRTWQLIQTGLSNAAVSQWAVDPSNASVLYAGTDGSGVLKSTNQGQNWSLLKTGLMTRFISALAVDRMTMQSLYVTDEDGVHKSLAGSGQWTAIGANLCPLSITALAVDPTNSQMLLAGTFQNALFRTTDGGNHWIPVTAGLPSDSWVEQLVLNPINSKEIFSINTTLWEDRTSAGVFKSTDGGENWSLSLSGDCIGLAIDPSEPDVLYVVQTESGNLMKSVDGGLTWQTIGKSHDALYGLAVDPFDSRVLYMAASDSFLKSTDNGITWVEAVSGLDSPTAIAFDADPLHPGVLYLITYAGSCYRSTNRGDYWVPMELGFPSVGASAHLVVDPVVPNHVYAAADGVGVFELTLENGILLVMPDGGEKLSIGSMMEITWTTVGEIEKVNIEISINGGLTFTPLASGIPNQGHFRWQVLNLPSQNCLIRVTDPRSGYSDTSKQTFSILDCGISISPTSQAFDVLGTYGGFTVTAEEGCQWTAVSNDFWIVLNRFSFQAGTGNGTVGFQVTANAGAATRTGTITVARQTFTVTQRGTCSPVFSPLSAIWDAPGGSGQVEAQVSAGCPWTAASNVPWLTLTSATSGNGNATLNYSVSPNPTGNPRAGTLSVGDQAFTINQTRYAQSLFVPVVLSTPGLKGSFFSSELTLANRGRQDATIDMVYTVSTEVGPAEGSGTVSISLPARRQQIIPDAIRFLKSAGLPIPDLNNSIGTLDVHFAGLSSAAEAAVTVRTTTPTPSGRAGLAYSGIPASAALNGVSWICGLRENDSDRSNLALQNLGRPETGGICLHVSIYSEDGTLAWTSSNICLDPGAFHQESGILQRGQVPLSSGYVRVERVTGKAPYYAYGVINDQANSDGSFIPAQPESPNSISRLVLPVIVEANGFSSELILTNWSPQVKTLHLDYLSSAISTPDNTASQSLTLNPGQQLRIPEYVQYLRTQGVAGIGPVGPHYAGALFASPEEGDLSSIFLGARTSIPGDHGRYGVFYTAIPAGSLASQSVWVYGMQQDEDNRTNLAIVNSGEVDASVDGFEIDVYNGESGLKVATVPEFELNARGWKQFNSILLAYAPGVTQAYAQIRRTHGNNPFLAYTVTNDGGRPGDRTGDGSFISAQP
jgi:photosystem II stability/assembly factor-like uncharacterized protein